MIAKVGEEQVKIWRRSLRRAAAAARGRTAPTPSLQDDRRYAGIDRAREREPQGHDRARAALLRGGDRAGAARGERVLVAAHGNSLRALEKHLSNIGDDEIVGLEIPTGQPIVYELGGGGGGGGTGQVSVPALRCRRGRSGSRGGCYLDRSRRRRGRRRRRRSGPPAEVEDQAGQQAVRAEPLVERVSSATLVRRSTNTGDDWVPRFSRSGLPWITVVSASPRSSRAVRK
jgi:broad specificity phosphatase PhoE